MKRIIAFMLILICVCSFAHTEQPATPTDLYIFDDNDYGSIDIELLERKVYLDYLKKPEYYGDEVILVAILVDFRAEDKYYFEWEESEDGENWWLIPDAAEQTYGFILDSFNANHYWRVKVILI